MERRDNRPTHEAGGPVLHGLVRDLRRDLSDNSDVAGRSWLAAGGVAALLGRLDPQVAVLRVACDEAAKRVAAGRIAGRIIRTGVES